jgi:hypothetical protein
MLVEDWTVKVTFSLEWYGLAAHCSIRVPIRLPQVSDFGCTCSLSKHARKNTPSLVMERLPMTTNIGKYNAL